MDMGQQILNPIDVAGWQENHDWISTGTLPMRWEFGDYLLNRYYAGNKDQFRNPLKDMIGEMLRMERHSIQINEYEKNFEFTIGDCVSYDATIVTNAMTEQPVKVVGMMHPAGDELTLANVNRVDMSIMGVSMSGENLNGFRSQFSWAA